MKLPVIALFVLLLALGSVSAQPDVRYSSVTLSETNDGGVLANFIVTNVGDEKANDFLVEIQPLNESEKFFSLFGFFAIVAPKQDVCDNNYPKNVHRFIYDLGPGERVNINLVTPPLKPTTYTIKGVSTPRCFASTAVKPFGWGTNLGSITTKNGPQDLTCGNLICEAGENPDTCSIDCGSGFLGDGYCSGSEKYPDEPACPKNEPTDGAPPPPPPPPPPPIPDDKDSDGFLDSEDKCPDTPGVDATGKKLSPEENKKRYSADSPLRGCPLIQIIPSSVKVIDDKDGDGKPDFGFTNNYLRDERVPVMFSLIKDDNFDLTGLSIEAGIYELNSPFLGTFATIPPEEVLASRGLQEIPTCQAESNVQAANIIEVSAFAFGDFKNEATYILLPKVPSGQALLSQKTWAVQATAYTKCGEPITSNAEARVTSNAQNPPPKHNILVGDTCVTVSGSGEDSCPIATEQGPGTPTGTAKALTIDELDDATNAKLKAALCNFNEECEKIDGFKVTCINQDKLKIDVGTGLAGLSQKLTDFFFGTDIEKDGLCIAEPVEKAGFCQFAEKIAFFDIGGDKCTSGGIIFFGAIIILFMLFFAIGGRKGG